MSYRYGPTAIGSRSSWGPISSPTVTDKPFDRPLSSNLERSLERPLTTSFDRPLSGNFDRIFNAFERSNAFEYVNKEERHIGHGDIVVNRKMSSSFERADCALAAQTPCSEDEDFYREKILYSQARQLFPLQEDLADWINKTIGITYLTGENFLDVLDNGVELCQLAAVIHDRAREAIDSGLIVGPVPAIRGRCWQRAARRSFFSRDNTENFITFCKDLGVHDNLLFESDDLVLHNQPRQVILCLLEVARLASKFGLEPPGLVQLEKEIAMEERDSGLDSAMSGAAWQFRDASPPCDKSTEQPPTTPDPNDTQLSVLDNADAESTKSEGTVGSTDSDVPLKPTNELDKRVQLVTRLMQRGCSCGAGAGRCNKLLKVKKVGEGRYNIAGRNVFIRLLKGRHMMVRVGGGWDTLEHFLSRHEPCQVRLVTAGRRDLLPVSLAPTTTTHAERDGDTSRKHSLSLSSSKSSLKDASLGLSDGSGKVSPVGGKITLDRGKITPDGGKITPDRGKISPDGGKITPDGGKITPDGGKISPVGRTRSRSSISSGKSSPVDQRSTSTPKAKPSRAGLTLPLDTVDSRQPSRIRKQSAPSSSTTGRSVRTPPAEMRKSLTSTSLTNTPKKSRSMSLALHNENNNSNSKKPFCGTDRLNARKSHSAATTPTEPRNTRSQSLASTAINDAKKTLTNGYGKKTRSMSLANPVEFKPLSNKSVSVNGAITQAAIEESIRLSLAASIADDSSKKPFLHIKAKYRSPPPREVPPR